jgi:hypothetical protein
MTCPQTSQHTSVAPTAHTPRVLRRLHAAGTIYSRSCLPSTLNVLTRNLTHQLVSGHPYIEAEVVYAAEQEYRLLSSFAVCVLCGLNY